MARRQTNNQERAGISPDGVAWCIRPWGGMRYVGSLKGDGGKDWGWTAERSQALPLTPHWQRRYRGNRRACGITFVVA